MVGAEVEARPDHCQKEDGVTTAREEMYREWREKNPVTPADIAQFYKETPHSSGDLEMWHDAPERQAWTDTIVKVWEGNPDFTSVLDVGCGRGHDLLAISNARGVDWLAGVEPNDINRMHCQETIEGRFASDLDEVAPDFDLVLCLDVLEHVPDPVAMVDKIAKHVRVGGVLAESTATTDVATPLHLKSNWGWKPSGQLIGLGFVLRYTDGNFHLWERTSLPPIQPTQSILLCAYRSVTVKTFRSIMSLATPGWGVRLLEGDALITRVRATAVSQWWRDTPDDVFLMLDDDISFRADDADRLVHLCRSGYDIICGAYVKADATDVALRMLPDSTVIFGPGQEPVEVKYAATGFMAVHRRVIEALKATLPLCHPDQPWSFWPMFTEFVRDSEFLSEDFAFCARARDAGFAVWLDPTIVTAHTKPRELTLDDLKRARGIDPNATHFGIHTPVLPDVLMLGTEMKELGV